MKIHVLEVGDKPYMVQMQDRNPSAGRCWDDYRLHQCQGPP